MELQHCFPVWNKLTAAQQEALHRSTREKQVKKGALLHAGGQDCTGLLIVRQGQLRAYILSVEAERDTALGVVPAEVYRGLMEQSAAVANYTNDLMGSRFSEVMWLMEQIMWRSFDQRLAQFLLQESALEESDLLPLTHERIAAHLGTAREVVTRMLRYFQGEGMVRLARGSVELTDVSKLKALCGHK